MLYPIELLAQKNLFTSESDPAFSGMLKITSTRRKRSWVILAIELLAQKYLFTSESDPAFSGMLKITSTRRKRSWVILAIELLAPRKCGLGKPIALTKYEIFT